MVKVYVLSADEGDFLVVSYGKQLDHHILIDGGLENCGDDYAKIIEIIAEKRQQIDAVILTHIDSDHIQGAIKGLDLLSKDILKKTIKKIYFNTCRGYLRKKQEIQSKKKFAEDEIEILPSSKVYSLGEAITFLQLLDKKELIDILDDYVISGREIELSEGAVLKIISPEDAQLRALCEKWEKYGEDKSSFGYAPNMKNIEIDLSNLMKERLTVDSSVNNASSIAFIFEYEETRIAFLGDSLAKVCLNGIKKFNENKDMDVVKISHHGSRSNTSDKLLKQLGTNCYILSTDGNRGMVPSKVLIAHLLKQEINKSVDEQKKVSILCNYPWWENVYHRRYFTKKDKEEYFKTYKINLKELDDEGYKVKDGLIIYGEYR